MNILAEIVAHKHHEVAAHKRKFPLSTLLKTLSGAPQPRDFASALTGHEKSSPRVIAEIKRRSPSKGLLRANLDPASIARTYEENGAAAISVLSDSRFFGGSLDDLRAVRGAVAIPVLCKEFVVDPYQLYEARLAGADAILLIAGILATVELRELRLLASSLGMCALVEVHNRPELAAALASGAQIIGINNRDLATFNVSLATTRELLPLMPEGIITVSESGISTQHDRAHMATLGVDALLVGESLIRAADIASATREICGLSQPILEESLA